MVLWTDKLSQLSFASAIPTGDTPLMPVMVAVVVVVIVVMVAVVASFDGDS